jgi:hypothetical protein
MRACAAYSSSMRRARNLPLLFLLSIASVSMACAPTSSVQWTHLPHTQNPATATTFVCVMQPILAGNATGNSSSNFQTVEQAVALSIIAAARERVHAERLDGIYDEEAGIRWAERRGATHLLVPIIDEWRQMRTDDPIGSFILPHNRIVITLRLLRLQPRPRPAVETGRVTFSNRARLTLNQSAENLLDDRFSAVVRELIRTGT